MTTSYKNCIVVEKNEIKLLDNLEWSKQCRSWNLSGNPFYAWHASDDSFNYFKPYKQYSKLEFEMLFKFKMGSPDFDMNRIVKYKK
tara:strand:- start:2509 stop:2766 length:258 start_codon:yes stop_codon:yes gene_type:complete